MTSKAVTTAASFEDTTADQVIDLTDDTLVGRGGVTRTRVPAQTGARRHAGPMAAFDHAVSVSAGYRAWLAGQGVDPARTATFAQVPYLRKQDVFGPDLDAWIEGGTSTAAAELLTSSGQSGTFSVGISSRAELQGSQVATDAALRAIGAGDGRTTLLLNCLPMGISVPTTTATVAAPSVHLEMAQELLERFGSDFDLVVVLAQPLFLKELAERLCAVHGPVWRADRLACFVGGEWVAESWRRHVSGLLGLGPAHAQGTAGILISMGAAELGLHLLFETPRLRAIRSVLDESGRLGDLFAQDWGYTPTLFTFDRSRLHVEERRHDDGTTTLVATPLARRLLPLVRYDLDDLGEIVPAERLNARLEALGAPQRVDGPVVACWGRRSTGLTIDDRVVRPELVKQRLFGSPTSASELTGRFWLQRRPRPALHLQLRPAAAATPQVTADARAFLDDAGLTGCDVEVHPHDRYPFHRSGDFQHKPTYHRAT